jgi:hypothetical protein
MKVLFLQRSSLWMEFLGQMYLATSLRRAGHEVVLRFAHSTREISRAIRSVDAVDSLAGLILGRA